MMQAKQPGKKAHGPGPKTLPELTKSDLENLLDCPPWDWPKNISKRLRNLILNRAAPEEDRLLAAELSPYSLSEENEQALAFVGILTDQAEPEALRCRAAISLGPWLEEFDTTGPEDFEEPSLSESTARLVMKTLHDLWVAPETPQALRRKVLEASVRAPQDWHPEAVRAAQAKPETAWLHTALFCMRFIRGFETEIVEALNHPDREVRCGALFAAGNWAVKAAEPTIRKLLTSKGTDKELLIAAIEALGSLLPEEAGELLLPYLDSSDPDIAEAALDIFDLLEENLDEDDEDDAFENLEVQPPGDGKGRGGGRIIPFGR